jgi:abortive infection Abi-like protein
MFGNDLPSSQLERAKMLEGFLIGRATGDTTDHQATYSALRQEFMGNLKLRALLPDFVRINRTLDMFWPFIKSQADSYAERRRIIYGGFTPLMDYLEGKNRAPADEIVSDRLQSFDSAGVHEIWNKALNRRKDDPEGAITIARTLLETVCKRILDDQRIAYTNKEDLPKLYSMAAKSLNLAPEQHSEQAIRAILSGVMTVVNGLGTLRNKLSDSHGRGGAPVRPSPRHASLAVNLAGALATFLVETHLQRAER